MVEFTGFRTETFQFLEDLGKNNSPEWFEEHASVFEEHVLEPMRGLVLSLREGLGELRPTLLADEPDAHFSEMRRGPRTPPGTPPIKTSLYAFFWDQDVRRLVDGNLFVGVTATGITIGFSIYDFGDPQSRMLRVFKPRLVRHLNLLDELIKTGYLRRGFDFHRYVRAASRLGMREVDPFPSAATEWETTLGWVARRHIHTESSRLTPGSFVAEVLDSFQRLYPLYLFAGDTTGEFDRLARKTIASMKPAPRPAPKSPPKPATAVADAPAKADPPAKSDTPAKAAAPAKAKAANGKASAAKKKTSTTKKKAAETTAAAPEKKSVAKKKATAKKAAAKKSATRKASSKKKAAAKKKTSAKKKASTKKATAKKKTAAKKRRAGTKGASARKAGKGGSEVARSARSR